MKKHKLFSAISADKSFINTMDKIASLEFIYKEKWDWDHGLGHVTRVALYIKKMLSQLNCDNKIIDLGMVCGLLHDIGLLNGNDDHSQTGAVMAIKYLEQYGIDDKNMRIVKQAIENHSSGKNITSLIGAVLMVADKIDITYQRVINSKLKDKRNLEVMKIKNIDVNIDNASLIINYIVDAGFSFEVFKEEVIEPWNNKPLTIPAKVAQYLNKKFIFKINDKTILI